MSLPGNITGSYTGPQLWAILIRDKFYGEATVEYVDSAIVGTTIMDFQYRIYGPVYDHKEARRVTFTRSSLTSPPTVTAIGEPGTGLYVLPTPLESLTREQIISFCQSYYYGMTGYGISAIRKFNQIDAYYLDLDFDVSKNNQFVTREARRFKLERLPSYVTTVSEMGANGSGVTTPIFTDSVNEVVPSTSYATIAPIPEAFVNPSPLVKGMFYIKHMGYYLSSQSQVQLPGELATRIEFVGSTSAPNAVFIRHVPMGGGTAKYLRAASAQNITWTSTAPTEADRNRYEWLLTDGENPSSYFIRSAYAPTVFLQYKYTALVWGLSGKMVDLPLQPVK